MNSLKIVSINGQFVTDSRDVAEMINQNHKELLRAVRGYEAILLSARLRSVDFFIPHEYQDSTNRKLRCYLLTKKGCDMVANKMTGEKGVLFTAEYVTRFAEMEEAHLKPKPLTEKEQLMATLRLSLETAEEIVEVKKEIAVVRNIAENQITLDYGEQHRMQKAVAIKVYEFESNPNQQRKLFRELYREIKDRFAVASYKDVKRKDLQNAIRYVDAWLPRRVS